MKLPRGGTAGVTRRQRGTDSFTLFEVLLAMAMFFIGIFAILNLVTQNLRIARELNEGQPDIGTVAAELFMEASTNKDLRGGSVSGDFGELYPGATWSASVNLVLTNSTSRGRDGDPGLYEADITVSWPHNSLVKERKTSLLIYLP